MPIILIILLGLILRLVSINQSLWLDEATTALVAKMSVGDIFKFFLPGDFHPPLYYLLIKYWTIIFGTSEVALRIPSVIFGIGTVYVSFLIARHFFKTKAGFVAALLISTNCLAIYYSQEARMYALTTFLVCLIFYYFIKKRWILLGVALVFLSLTDYVGLLILPVLWISGYTSLPFILSNISLIISLSFLSPLIIGQFRAGLGVEGRSPEWWNLLGVLSPKNILLIPFKFIAGRISLANNPYYYALLTFYAGMYTWLCIRVFKKAKLVWLWLVIPLLLGVVISIKVPILSYFRFLFCLPALIILVAGSVSTLKRKLFFIVLPLLVVGNILTSSIYLASPTFHRENWRDLAAFVESHKVQNSLILFPSGANMEAYRYYAPNAKITGPEGVRGDFDQIWIMDYLSSVFDREGKSINKVKSFGFFYINGYNFNGLGVSEYKK